MKFTETIGIDVSKLTLDACIHGQQILIQVPNTKQGHLKLLSWAKKSTGCSIENILFCFEHTGIYSSTLARFMTEMELNYIIVPGLEIKRSLGIQRGKNDQIDAKKIAQYAYRRRDEVTIYKAPDKSINKIRQLLSLREKLVKQRSEFMTTLKDQDNFIERSKNKLFFSIPQKLIKELNKQIENIEKEVDIVLEESPEIMDNFKLITSITGIGRQTALLLIVVTNNFLWFSDSRKLASYAGVAPFPYTSGTSIKGRTKVSPLANKKLKSLLSSCAVSAIRNDPEMKIYFNRRTKSGKHKMNTINAVRNKLLSRVFAVVKRRTPYISLYQYAA
jgi:transposase